MIYGENLRLRAPEREDISTFVKWFNDPEVRSGISMVYPMSRAEEEIWFDSMLKSPQPERTLVIEKCDGKQWTMIGTCGYHIIDWRNRSAELGIVIGEKQLWDMGFGTETMSLLIEHGFNTLNLNRIALQVFSSNPRAIRAYEKAGFIKEGVLRQAIYKNGNYSDIFIMSVLKSEWKG